MKHETVLPYYLFSSLIIVGSLLFAFRNTDISLKEKQVLTGILKDKPTEHHFRTSLKFYDDVRFSLSAFAPSFIIENFEYKASSRERILTDLNKGDTITVWIDKEEPNSKAEGKVRVYQLQHKRVSYVNVDERNAVKSRYSKYALIVTLYGVILIVYQYRTGRNISFKWMLLVLGLMIVGIYRITK